jgi:chromate transport protein ChrA
MLTTIGLVLVSLAWIFQVYQVFKGKKEIQKTFLGLYILGVVFLVINGFNLGSNGSWFDLLTIILAGLVFIKISNKPKQKKKK